MCGFSTSTKTGLVHGQTHKQNNHYTPRTTNRPRRLPQLYTQRRRANCPENRPVGHSDLHFPFRIDVVGGHAPDFHRQLRELELAAERPPIPCCRLLLL